MPSAMYGLRLGSREGSFVLFTTSTVALEHNLSGKTLTENSVTLKSGLISARLSRMHVLYVGAQYMVLN